MCVFQTFQVLRNFTILYNKDYQQMRLFFGEIFLFTFPRFPYMFQAFTSPSSGVYSSAVYVLPLGSCSALLGYGAENALQDGGQVSTSRHLCRWCPFFRLGFRFLPHVPTTPRTSAPLLHHPFTAFPPSTHHHIHIPRTPRQ